jgi:hypothetical protein
LKSWPFAPISPTPASSPAPSLLSTPLPSSKSTILASTTMSPLDRPSLSKVRSFWREKVSHAHFSPQDVRAAPTLSLERANASVTLPTRYTVAMIDAETVGFDQAPGQNRHWLVNGVTLTGGSLQFFSFLISYITPLNLRRFEYWSRFRHYRLRWSLPCRRQWPSQVQVSSNADERIT